MPDPTDPYKVLQVDPAADVDVIQAAYRRLARTYHPDLAKGPDAAARMASINAAWEILRDTTRRAAFDLARSGGAAALPAPPSQATSRPPETVSRDWTSGRSSQGGGFDDSMRTEQGFGAAGPPPGRPSGSVINFGRYAGWSLGEIARRDLDYLEWLDRMPIGRAYRDEIDRILRSTGRRRSSEDEAEDRRGLYRRR